MKGLGKRILVMAAVTAVCVGSRKIRLRGKTVPAG